jgi:hypothetical protein
MLEPTITHDDNPAAVVHVRRPLIDAAHEILRPRLYAMVVSDARKERVKEGEHSPSAK